MKQWLRNYFGTLRTALDNHATSTATYQIPKDAKALFEKRWKDNRNVHDVRLADFELIRVLGRGKFGNVVFARYRKLRASDLEGYVAVKVMVKRVIANNRGPQHVINERRVIKSIENPFFIEYKHHFKDNANLFLVTEYVPGGDFYTRLKRIHIYEESHVVFYAAQIVLAFEYLHYMGVVYRDLKPENVLLDRIGYIKLADLGLCKKIDLSTTKTMCGTPEYLAPEVVHGHAYSYSVDWWTLGIFIYELVHGRTPFRSGNMLQLLRKIVHADVIFPKPEINASSQDLITKLLSKQRTERLSNAIAIKNMAYFAGVDWAALYDKTVPAPYLPVIKSMTDTANFEKQAEITIEESEVELYADKFSDF